FEIDVGDLKLATGAGLQVAADLDDLAVIDIKAGDRVGTLWMLGLFLETKHAATCIELDHAVALGIAHLVSEDARAIRQAQRFPKEIEVPVENVVAKNEADRRIIDELCPDEKGLRNARGPRL